MLFAMDSKNSPAAHFDHAVGKNGSVVSVMRDVDHRQMEGLLQADEFRSQLGAKLRVKTRKRLVQQQNTRLANDCSCKGNTLLFSAGKLVWVAGGELLDPNKRQCLVCSAASVAAGQIHRSEHEIEILPNRQVRPEGQVLEHEPEPSLVRGYDGATCVRHRRFIQQDVPGVRDFQSADDPEQGRLATPAGSEDHRCAPGRDLERDVVQRQV